MKVRKRPIEVDAWCLENEDTGDQPNWVKKAIKAGSIRYTATPANSNFANYWTIETLEGTATAYDGDFVIRGVEGELYPCAREIFFKTYDIEI